MADKAVTDLTAGTIGDGSEVLHAVQGANSRKFTFTALREWFAGFVNDFTKNQIASDGTLTDGATVSIDAQAAFLQTLTTTQNCVLGNPSNMPGASHTSTFMIEVTASGAARTPTVGSYWENYTSTEIPSGKSLLISCIARGTDRVIVVSQVLEA